ncbi:MAG: hypothetical protein K6G18_04205 [Treponema sp.]|nr:hypothetical protein [Treponema sp.]
MEEHNKRSGLKESFYAQSIPILLASLAFACLAGALRNRVSNLVLYAASCLLFFAVYFAASLATASAARSTPATGDQDADKRADARSTPAAQGHLGERATAQGGGENRKRAIRELAALLAIAVLLLANFFREGRSNEGADFNASLFRYQIPLPAYLLLLAGTTAASYGLVKLLGKSRRRPLARLLASLPYVLLLALTTWVPNIFYSDYTFFHADAYYSSICDVLNLAPLGELDKPFYGHYALFFLLPCRLLHLLGMPYHMAIASCIAAASLATLLATLCVVDRLVKNDGVFLIALLSLGDVFLMYVQKLFFVKDVYLQTIPHRVMFPAILSAAMVLSCGKRMGKGRIAAFYALAALAFLWSPETGLVCIASVSLFVFLGLLDFSRPVSRANVARLACCALLAVLSVLSGYLLVTAYNLLTSGQGVSFKGFLYPLVAEYGSIAVRTPLPDLLRTWLPVLLFLLSATAVFAGKALGARDGRGTDAALLCSAVTALGLMSYFMNNPVQLNITIVFFQCIMLLAPLLDALIREERNFALGPALSLLLLAVFSTFTLGNAGMKEVLTDRRATAWKARGLENFARELDGDIPRGTPAFGRGVPELFAAMDRDPGVHVIDWVDIMFDRNPIYLQHVNGQLKDADRFFAYQDSAALLPASADFAIEKEYEYMGWKFALYRRK